MRSDRNPGAMEAGEAARFALTIGLSVLAFGILLLLADRTGAPESVSSVAAALVIVSLAIMLAFQTATMSFRRWLLADRVVPAVTGAFPLAALLLFFSGIPTLAARFFHGSIDALVWIMAPLVGAALSSVLFSQGMRKSGASSVGELVSARFANRAAGIATATAAFAASFLLLASALKIALQFSALFIPASEPVLLWGAVGVVSLCVIPGGQVGVLRAGGLAFIALATAYIVPVVWHSVVVGGFPIPQLSYGLGAVHDIRDIEAQLAAIGGTVLSRQIRVPDALELESGVAIAGVLAVFIALGLSATPALIGQFPAGRRIVSGRRAIAKAILLAALVLSTAPAIAAFTKLSLYDSLLGLSFADPSQVPEWLHSRKGQFSPAVPGEPMIQVCRQSNATLDELVSACGGSREFIIGPSDISLSPEVLTLDFGSLSGLPDGLAVMMAAAIVALALAGACGFGFSTGTAFVRLARSREDEREGTGTGKLYTARLITILAMIVAGQWVLSYPISAAELMAWGLAIALGVLLPVLAGALWWTGLTTKGALGGLGTGLFLLALLALPNLPATLIGDQGPAVWGLQIVRLPGLEALSPAVSAGFISLAFVACAVLTISYLTRGGVQRQNMDAIVLPDTEAPLSGPSI